MTIAAGLREAWGIVAGKAPGIGLRADHFAGGGPRVWATVNDNNCRGLLITARPDERLATTVATVAKASSALSAEIYHFADEGVDLRGLHLWCQSTELLEAFVGFCEPFVVRLQRGEGIEQAFSVCFEEFRRLVAGTTESPVPPGIVGLLGELIVLDELVAQEPQAIAFWPFPTRERHDFRNGAAALEVKTSLRSHQSSPTVTISALDQLDPPSGGTLYLHWLRLERDPTGPVTLMRLLENIAGRLTPAAGTDLRTRVLGSDEAKAYHLHSFALQERKCFRVLPPFPKLTPARLLSGALDPGVGRVSYELDLSMAAEFECAAAEALQALLAGGASQ